jgi:hypothetical protein
MFIDLTVALNGTWKKCRCTSLNGKVSTTKINKGKVVAKMSKC